MSLTAGSRIGPYEVIAPLGAGGMGAVYRARDTKLNRTVAIKAMHESVAGDPERVARFEREAQLLASLNHPNIAAIHGLQESDTATYLVLEFVEGRTLADTIRDHGAFSTADAMTLARQIADAIAAAHDKGIIHRDLKPGNIMITPDNQVKVLDFGLGKALPSASEEAASHKSNSPTMTLAATQQGIILGTAGYMSPEQARGRVADKRSDVWAFGCVLFEMLARKRAFEGEDITDTLAAIVRGEPDWAALPQATPPPIRLLIERCLIKDRGQRLPDMSVVRYILSEPGTVAPGSKDPGLQSHAGSGRSPGSSDPGAERTSGLRVALPLVAALIVAAVLATLGIQRFWSGSSAAAPAAGFSRFTIVLPPGDEVGNTNTGPLAVSPDGTTIAYGGTRGGKQFLFVRHFADDEPKLLAGTDGARTPFFSHDGRWVGFFANTKLKKITLAGTGLQELADVPDNRGGTWSADDTIYFAPTNTSGLLKVSASGGPVSQVTTPDRNAGEISHRWPFALADGKALLFSVWTGPGFDEHRVERLSLVDGQRHVLFRGADGMLASAGGYLLHGGRLDGILAVPWQPSQTSLQSVEPVVLPMEARIDNEGAVAYAVSRNGTFAYIQGAATRRLARIVWIDPSGSTEEVPVPARDYVSALISPDGRQAVLQIRGGTEELWIFDFVTKTLTPLVAAAGSSQAPVWTMDGRFLIYRCTRGGFRNLCKRPADGTGAEERLTTKSDVVQTPTSVSWDGKWVVFSETGQAAAGGNDIWKLPLDGADRTPVPLVTSTVADYNGHVSPDGRWIAYESAVSGRNEIWVQPFATEGRRQPVSRDGGLAPRWSRDGRELLFTSGGSTAVMSAAISGDIFQAPRVRFEGRYRPSGNANTNYDVAKDGRILHVQQIMPAAAVTRIEIVINGLAKAGVR